MAAEQHKSPRSHRRRLWMTPPRRTAKRGPAMPASVINFQQRQRERLARLASDTRLHARTDSEAGQVVAVCQAVRTGHLDVRDAHAALAALRREQQQAA